MNILLAASEVAPIIKIGGLGDVAGSLPLALEKIGVDADVIVPFYPIVKTEGLPLYKSFEISVPFNEESNNVEVYKSKLPNSDVDVILLKNDKYFMLGGQDFYAKNVTETEMFTFFSKAVVEYIKSQFNTYDVVHCNDWHTGLITHLLKDEIGEERPRTLFTIHNIMYQGIGGLDTVWKAGIVPGEHPLIDWDISDGDLNLMLQGITSSDYVNTVSESYAEEILTKEFGGPFYEILQGRKARLSGILNGIHYSYFPRNFDENNFKNIKDKNKEELQKELGLEVDKNKPLFSFIGRIDPGQKGLDILYTVVEGILDKKGQFVLLGTGDKAWEQRFKVLAKKKSIKENFSCNIMFDTQLANKIYAASDFLLIPSKYEPCGLIQMISMWYGTIPIANNVGGLKDTIEHDKTGILFSEYSSKALIEAILHAFKVYYEDKDLFNKMRSNALEQDFSWEKSAEKYKDLYQKIVEEAE